MKSRSFEDLAIVLLCALLLFIVSADEAYLCGYVLYCNLWINPAGGQRGKISHWSPLNLVPPTVWT